MKASFREPCLRLYVAELLGLTGDSRALKELERVKKDDEKHQVREYTIWPYKQIIDRKHLAQCFSEIIWRQGYASKKEIYNL